MESLPEEVVSIILHMNGPEDRNRARLLCKLYSRLVKPSVYRYEQLLNLNVLCVLWKNIPSKRMELKRELKYDSSEVKMILVCKDERPSIYNLESVLGCLRLIAIVSDNRAGSYSYYSNYRLVEVDQSLLNELTEDYKYIGDKITRVEVPRLEELKSNDITLEGNSAIMIHFNTKILRLACDFTDCYYPETIWEFL